MGNEVNTKRIDNDWLSSSSFYQANKETLIDFKYLEGMSGGDKAFFVELMTVFKNESLIFLKKMYKEFLLNDLKSLAKTAHSMKPNGSYLGVKSLTMLLGHLEEVAEAENNEQADLLLQQVEKTINAVIVEINEFLKKLPQ